MSKKKNATAPAPAAAAKPPRRPAAAEILQARERAAAWWAAAYSLAERMAMDAEALHREAKDPGSPLADVFHPDRLFELAGSLQDLTSRFANCVPEAAVQLPDPFARSARRKRGAA